MSLGLLSQGEREEVKPKRRRQGFSFWEASSWGKASRTFLGRPDLTCRCAYREGERCARPTHFPLASVQQMLRHQGPHPPTPVSYTHLRAHETKANLVCRLLLEKKKNNK